MTCGDLVKEGVRNLPGMKTYEHGDSVYKSIKSKQDDGVRNATELIKKREKDMVSGVLENDSKTPYTLVYQAIEQIKT